MHLITAPSQSTTCFRWVCTSIQENWYYLTPTAWIAADGRYEQYGFGTQPVLTTQQRFGLEASYQFPWQQRYLTLRGRLEYTTLEEPGVAGEHAVNFQLSTRWRF